MAIHANGLEAGDFAVLHDHGVGIVWSPLSNLLLYGGTTNIAAAHANDVPVALGSDWSPSGSRNLLAELKIARIVNAGLSPSPYKDRDLVAMATRNPATMLGWGDEIGSLADGHYADLLVIAGTDGDPYDHLLTASERDIELVVIDGVARFGRATLIEAAAPGATFETVKIGGLSRRLNLVEADADPVVGGLTLGAARAGLTNALANLAALAKLLEDPPPAPRWPRSPIRPRSGSSSSITTSRPAWRPARTCPVRTARRPAASRCRSRSPASRCRRSSSR